LPLKDSAWACLLGKNGAFLEPWKQAFWPSPECREPFEMLPGHALSSFMVWNAEVRPWWAATAEIFKVLKLSLLCSTATMHPVSIEL